MKPKIAVVYSLARSGGTLICKCLGCIDGNLLLSEVNPRWAYFNPIVQASQWFGLFSTAEVQELARGGNLFYVDAIRMISERCRRRNLDLIIRDWTHVDFTPGPYPVGPAFQLSQYAALQQDFDIRQVAVTRNPLDAFLSVSQLPEYRGKLTPSMYFAGFRRYADLVSGIGYVRYEDFCADPVAELRRICATLEVHYDDAFMDRYQDYGTITGESYQAGREVTLTGEAVGLRASGMIRRPPRRALPEGLLQELETNDDYRACLEILGYAPTG